MVARGKMALLGVVGDCLDGEWGGITPIPSKDSGQAKPSPVEGEGGRGERGRGTTRVAPAG